MDWLFNSVEWAFGGDYVLPAIALLSLSGHVSDVGHPLPQFLPDPVVTGKGGGGGLEGAKALVAEAVFPLCCNLLLNLQVSIIFTNTVWPGPMQGGLFATRETIS